jgi:hypothetical protein
MKTTFHGHRRAVSVLIVALCVHAAFCASLYYHFLDPLFYITTHSKGQAGPFFGIYQAGVDLVHGESIYGSDNYSFPTHLVVPYYHFYRYLPFASYVSSVFSEFIRPWPAYWCWVVINEILIGLAIVLTVRLRRLYGAAAIGVAAFWLLYSPMYIELYMGQVCLTMAFFIFLMLYPYIKRAASVASQPALADPGLAPRAAGRRMPAWLSSVSWVVTLLLKSFTVLYTPTLFKMGKKRLAAAGVSAAVLTSAPYFFFHPGDLSWFLRLNLQPLPPRLTGGCFGFCGFMRDIFAHAGAFLGTKAIRIGPVDVMPQNVPLMVLSAAIVLTSLYLTLRRGRIDPVASIALWTLTFFLIFKDIWEYHYVMLIPLFIAFYLETRSKFLLVLFIILAVPTPFVFYDLPATDDPQLFWSTPLSVLHHAFKAVPTFLFYLWVVRREISRGSRAPAPEPA